MSNPLASLGGESLRVVRAAVSGAKHREEQRLVSLAVREAADAMAFSLAVARQAGRVDALDALLSLIFEAERTA